MDMMSFLFADTAPFSIGVNIFSTTDIRVKFTVNANHDIDRATMVNFICLLDKQQERQLSRLAYGSFGGESLVAKTAYDFSMVLPNAQMIQCLVECVEYETDCFDNATGMLVITVKRNI